MSISDRRRWVAYAIHLLAAFVFLGTATAARAQDIEPRSYSNAPVGEYDDSRVVNIGTNRWAFRPEIGVSKAVGRWTFEGTASVTLFTDNTDFYGGTTRSQNPIYSAQGNVIYSFQSGIWAAAGITYFAGGRTTIGGVLSNDLQQNWRVGGLLAFPVNARNSLKVYASSGVSARTGNDFDAAGLAWQYRWGGGI